MEKRVGLMIIGSQKCGTTTLFDVLNTHPLLQGSSPKELVYFCSNPRWQDNIGEYHSHFEWAPGKIHFEGSVSYTNFPEIYSGTVKSLYEYNPDLKFIYLIRDPFERIVSAYMHLYARGFIDCTLEESILGSPKLINTTRYYMQLIPYIDAFGEESIFIEEFNTFINDRKSFLENVSAFLGVDYRCFPETASIHTNKSIGGVQKRLSKYDQPSLSLRLLKKVSRNAFNKLTDNSARSFGKRPELDETAREVVRRLLELDIKRLEELTKRKFDHWMT
ncbi:sulfotransferase [Pelagicoccus sp. SDUM812002]|uniref:sulfotransferase n=1 Tax=Pelagicoccus sp. SDUM812002 TaxID=3041266 RepID=UPI00280F3E16|nr:sulfotransferase [Pelagicoccus sp. SDUM812002]MDQ8187866.1 sulfotransferase [Pelagicoccus sp. SDUM812002]